MNQSNTTKTYIPGIYIESKPVILSHEWKKTLKRTPYKNYANSNHLLLVYRDKDGNERVIRGGPEDDKFIKSVFTDVPIEVQKDLPKDKSYDRYSKGTEQAVRRQRKLNVPQGREDEYWNNFLKTGDLVNDASIIYKNPSNQQNIQNSNATIRTILQKNGFIPERNLPQGVENHVPGYNTYLLDSPEFTKRVNIDNPKMPQLMDVDEQTKRLEQLKRQDIARKKILNDLQVNDNPALDILLKEDKNLTENEIKVASRYAMFEEKDPLTRENMNNKISSWYSSVFGDEPVKKDAAGRNIEPIAKIAVMTEPKELKTKEGKGMKTGFENLAFSMAEREEGIKAVQYGINQLGYEPPLKEDGVLGPKTVFGIKSSLVKHGLNKLQKYFV